MMAAIADRLRGFASRSGWVLQRELRPDFSEETRATIAAVRPFTMTTVERIAAICSAVEYIARYDIPGDIVESGCWMGGSSMAAARTLVRTGAAEGRSVYMYDTFEGIPAPGPEDALIGSDHEAMAEWWQRENADKSSPAWLDAPIESVRANMVSTGFPADRLHLIKGLVEETIPATAPDQIALLRLDTDWYASTKVEMEVLFPRLAPGGILIVDDYAFTEGSRKAVDEYLASFPEPVYLHRIDSCARLAIKPRVAGA